MEGKMKSPICDLLGVEFPLVAFTHCRDVVVQVSKAGGFGVLGAAGYDADGNYLGDQIVDWSFSSDSNCGEISNNNDFFTRFSANSSNSDRLDSSGVMMNCVIIRG